MPPESSQTTYTSERVIAAQRIRGGVEIIEKDVVTDVQRLLNDEDGEMDLPLRDGEVFRIEIAGKEPTYATRVSVRYEAGKVLMGGCKRIDPPTIQRGWGGAETKPQLKLDETTPDKKKLPGVDADERQHQKMAVELGLRAFIAREATLSPTGMRLAKLVLTRLGAWDSQKRGNEQLSSLNRNPHACVVSEIIVSMLFEKPANEEQERRQQEFIVLCQKIAAGEEAVAAWAHTLLTKVKIAVPGEDPQPGDRIAVVSGGRQLTILDVHKMLLEGTPIQREAALRVVASLCAPGQLKVMANHTKMRRALDDVADILDLTQRPKAAKGHDKFDRAAIGQIGFAMTQAIGGSAERSSLVDRVIKARDKLRQQPPSEGEQQGGS